MNLKQIHVFTMCILLTVNGQTMAVSPEASIPLISAILTQHRDIKSGAGSLELLSKHGKDLSLFTANFLADPKNHSVLKTSEGIELTQHQRMLNNFLAVKDHFEKCIKDKKSKRNLQERILQSGAQSITTPENFHPCVNPEVTSFNKGFLDFNNDVMKAMKKAAEPAFEKDLTSHVMTNTAKALLSFRFKFKSDFMKTGKIESKEIDEILNDVCMKKILTTRAKSAGTDLCEKNGPGFRDELTRILIDFSKTQKSSDKLTPENATISLNQSVDRLNSALEKIKIRKDIGYIFDSADLENEETKKGFDNYLNQFMAEVSSGAGTLLLTSTMKDDAGGIKKLHADDTQRNKKTNSFELTPHKKINSGSVRSSIKEAEEKMLEQARNTMEIAHKNGTNEANMSELVKMNPFAAGQLLMKKPEYAAQACEAINKVNQQDLNDESFDKYFTIGSALLGGALILTGVGTVAGAYIVTGSLTAGLASGTVGASVLGYSALAGGAVELANAGYYGKKSFESYQEMNRLEASFLTRNSDKNSLTDAKDALIEYKEARLSAGISLAGLGLGFAGAGKFFNIMKVSEKVLPTPGEIKAATKIMNYLSHSEVAKKVKDVAALMGETGMQRLDTFFLYLAKTGEASRLKFLEFLKDGKIVPEKIKEVINSALEAAKNCGKI